MGEHISSINTKDDESPVAIHFRDIHGASTDEFRSAIIYKLVLPDRGDKVLLQKEA